jgi:hypothetical protein
MVSRLAQPHASGLIGLWTFLPAYFCDLRVTTLIDDTPPAAYASPIDPGNIEAWFVEGFGSIACEPTGILNLNRYLPAPLGQVRLSRWIEVSDTGSIELEFGFSDDLTLQIDDQVIFTGQHIFHNAPAWEQRGYVAPTSYVSHTLTPGRHQLIATLKGTEPYFGWGLIVNLRGENFKILPVNLG